LLNIIHLFDRKQRLFLINKKMKSIGRVVAVFLLLLFAGNKGLTQITTQKTDTLQIKGEKPQTDKNQDDQNIKGQANVQANKDKSDQSIKQIKARRPDMSRARGARPPLIVRPSGSGIPKGIGKPGGVGRKPGR
jgi:hypothetical protein